MDRRSRNLSNKLKKIRRFMRLENRMPSYSEMLDLFGYKSKNAVHMVVHQLIELGHLQMSKGGKIAPTQMGGGSIKILGSVQAGFPSPAEEELVDVLSLDEFLIKRPDATFMLTVSGDSMIDAGIHPGDILLVEKGQNPKSGDIVVAQVDGEWTLKYYRRDRQGVFLEPANKRYKIIRPEQSLTIGGIVKAVIRKYG